MREGEGEWKHAAQPGPYRLGREFPWLTVGWGGGWRGVRDLTVGEGTQGWELVPGTGVVG